MGSLFALLVCVLGAIVCMLVPEPAQAQGDLLFWDDFSTDKGWTDESNGYIFRDPANEWLAYDVTRAETRRYYIPISAPADSVQLDFRFRVAGCSGNCNVFVGLLEALQGGSGWPWDGIGYIVSPSRTGNAGKVVQLHARFDDGALVLLLDGDNGLPYGSFDVWRRATFLISEGEWSLTIRTDQGILLSQASGPLPGMHNQYNYLMVFHDDIDGWESQQGMIDNITLWAGETPTSVQLSNIGEAPGPVAPVWVGLTTAVLLLGLVGGRLMRSRRREHIGT